MRGRLRSELEEGRWGAYEQSPSKITLISVLLALGYSPLAAQDKKLEIPPYPAVEGVSVLLKTLEKSQPKARAAKPEDFIDTRLMRELEKRGFMGRL